MRDIATKVTGSSLTADEFNDIPTELENAITSTDITLSAGDLEQLSQAIATYAAGGAFYTDAGSSTLYVLSAVGSKHTPIAYFNGMSVSFVASNNNTTATPTINVAGLGVKNIVVSTGVPLEIDDISTSGVTTLYYDGTEFTYPDVFASRGTKEYPTLAAAKADLLLQTSQKVSIHGRLAPDGVGTAEYIVVTGATGTPTTLDGEFIDLDNGLQLQLIIKTVVDPVQFGISDGVSSSDAIENALAVNGSATLGSGTFTLDKKKDFQPKPIFFAGQGHSTKLTVNNADHTGFRVAAVGSADRTPTKFTNITFNSAGASEGIAIAIDAQAVFPITLESIQMFEMGKSAIKYFQIFYGGMQDMWMRASGLDFNNVNNYTIAQYDFHGNSTPGSTYSATDYAVTLDDCDSIQFDTGTFEGFDDSRAIEAVENKNLVFKGGWFEGNTHDHVIKAVSCSDIHFIGCYMELFPGPTDAFILVDNTPVVGADRELKTLVTLRDSYLRLDNATTGNFKFVQVVNRGEVLVNMEGVSIRNGYLLVDRNVLVNARNITLSTTTGAIDEVKFFETIPVADLKPLFNPWIPESDHAPEWDWTSGAGFVEVGGATLTIATTTTVGEVHTGTTAVKTTIPDDSTEYVIQLSMSDMGPITTLGETHIIHMRIKTEDVMTLQFAVEGLFIEYQISPTMDSKKGQWIDYIFKTSSDVTFTQGTQGNPKINIKMTNNTAAPVDFLMDRIDYDIVTGDVRLP